MAKAEDGHSAKEKESGNPWKKKVVPLGTLILEGIGTGVGIRRDTLY